MPDLHQFRREHTRHRLALSAITVKHQPHIDADLIHFLAFSLTDTLQKIEGDSDEIERDRTLIRHAVRALTDATDHDGFRESSREHLHRALHTLAREFSAA
jgi:hypothetical protein